MKLGFLSDCHGNLQALEAAYHYLVSQHVDRVMMLGDIIGYGGQPRECVDFVRRTCDISVAGNHDLAASNPQMLQRFNPMAANRLIENSQMLNEKQSKWLSSLPMEFCFEKNGAGVVMTHGHPAGYEQWLYQPDNPHYFICDEEGWHTAWCFYGHTHKPAITLCSRGGVERTSVPELPQDHYIVPDDQEYTVIVNVGSCGLPRDGYPDACCVILDMPSRSVEFVRVGYDLRKTLSIFKERGVPEFLREKIQKGC
jgi:predicted phosphodiesterase